MGFMTHDQIAAMGFRSVGANVLLSDKASFYNCNAIRIGDNVRIDDFCVLSAGCGGIRLGSYIHLGVNTTLIGAGMISIRDYANISSRVAIYSSNDDYSGRFMTNPMVPTEFTNVTSADVLIGEHVIVGSGSVILPGVSLRRGVAVGALSLVNADCDEFFVYAGVPARKLKARKRELLEHEKSMKIAAHFNV